MWYGTVNGLCRDDGYHVKVFRSDIETPGLLEDNLLECIAEDKKGNIWFGTDKGVYILDKSDYSVHPIDVYKRQIIYHEKDLIISGNRLIGSRPIRLCCRGKSI